MGCKGSQVQILSPRPILTRASRGHCGHVCATLSADRVKRPKAIGYARPGGIPVLQERVTPRPRARRQSLPPAPPLPKGPPSRESVYSDALNADIDACKKRGDYAPPVRCYTKLSPAKCEDYALEMISGRPDMRRKWLLCVRSCATASVWSRTFGECAAP